MTVCLYFLLRGLVRDGVFVLPVQGDSGLDGPHGDPGPKGNLGRGVCDFMRLLEIESVCVCVLVNERVCAVYSYIYMCVCGCM